MLGAFPSEAEHPGPITESDFFKYLSLPTDLEIFQDQVLPSDWIPYIALNFRDSANSILTDRRLFENSGAFADAPRERLELLLGIDGINIKSRDLILRILGNGQ